MASLDFLPWKIKDTNDPVVVLTGAGVSMTLGLPGGPQLVKALLDTLAFKIGAIKKEQINAIAQSIPLETIFQIAADHIGEKYIQRIISGLNNDISSPLHIAIAQLLYAGCIRTIYTFNFDLLHEIAYNLSPIQTERNGRVIIKTFRNKNGNLVPLLKLHGSCDVVGVITISEYIRGFPSAIVQKLLRDLKDSYWLILGYGGWDIDFQTIIDMAIKNHTLPKEVIWIDKSFPYKGGRTDILNSLNEANVLTHKLKANIEIVAKKVLNKNAFDIINWKSNLGNLVNHLSDVGSLPAAGTIIETALNSGYVKIAEKILSSFSKDELIFERALLTERQGLRDESAKLYSLLVRKAKRPETRAHAAIRAFVLSQGKIDLFNHVRISELGYVAVRFFEVFATTRRTDVGGINRQILAHEINKLPSLDELIESVTSLDAARFFITIISELARVSHETEQWTKALDLDRMAYRIAQGIGDPAILGMCAGNIGVCYHSMAEVVTGNKKTKLLRDAQLWLEEAIKFASKYDKFAWSLHTCNLGLVLRELGDFINSLNLLKNGILTLEKVYPNYAVCFWGELSKTQILASQKLLKKQHDSLLKSAAESLRAGILLADRLNDWDDISYLRDAAKQVSKFNKLSDDLQWILVESD
ncbi:MAG: SIR2 family protein [Candidatus Hodarchaeota archaeon]